MNYKIVIALIFLIGYSDATTDFYNGGLQFSTDYYQMGNTTSPYGVTGIGYITVNVTYYSKLAATDCGPWFDANEYNMNVTIITQNCTGPNYFCSSPSSYMDLYVPNIFSNLLVNRTGYALITIGSGGYFTGGNCECNGTKCVLNVMPAFCMNSTLYNSTRPPFTFDKFPYPTSVGGAINASFFSQGFNETSLGYKILPGNWAYPNGNIVQRPSTQSTSSYSYGCVATTTTTTTTSTTIPTNVTNSTRCEVCFHVYDYAGTALEGVSVLAYSLEGLSVPSFPDTNASGDSCHNITLGKQYTVIMQALPYYPATPVFSPSSTLDAYCDSVIPVELSRIGIYNLMVNVSSGGVKVDGLPINMGGSVVRWFECDSFLDMEEVLNLPGMSNIDKLNEMYNVPGCRINKVNGYTDNDGNYYMTDIRSYASKAVVFISNNNLGTSGVKFQEILLDPDHGPYDVNLTFTYADLPQAQTNQVCFNLVDNTLSQIMNYNYTLFANGEQFLKNYSQNAQTCWNTTDLTIVYHVVPSVSGYMVEDQGKLDFRGDPLRTYQIKMLPLSSNYNSNNTLNIWGSFHESGTENAIENLKISLVCSGKEISQQFTKVGGYYNFSNVLYGGNCVIKPYSNGKYQDIPKTIFSSNGNQSFWLNLYTKTDTGTVSGSTAVKNPDGTTTPIGQVTIIIKDESNPNDPGISFTSDENGIFTLTGLREGISYCYVLSRFGQTTTPYCTHIGTPSQIQDGIVFYEIPQTSDCPVSGRINIINNSVRQPIADGTEVQLLEDGASVSMTTTVNGNYYFDGDCGKTYTVHVEYGGETRDRTFKTREGETSGNTVVPSIDVPMSVTQHKAVETQLVENVYSLAGLFSIIFLFILLYFIVKLVQKMQPS